MQLELSAQVEEALAAEGKTLGLSAAELSVQLLARHTAQSRLQRSDDASHVGWTIEDYIAHMISRNPNYKTTDPYATDWQSLKSEGRRY